MSRAHDLADAVVTYINGLGGLSIAVTSERADVVDYDIETLAGIKVPVVVREIGTEVESRGEDRDAVVVDVGIIHKLPDNDTASHVDLMEELMDAFRRWEPSVGALDVNLMGINAASFIEPRFLRERNVFLSVISLTFWVYVDAT